jgi:peptidoglycan/xylan/chitin deacetylase (PgdA/CDA1 family)
MLPETRLVTSKSARFAGALDLLGILDRLLWLRTKLGVNALTALTYHRVGRPEDAGELDPEVFDVEPEQLASQIEVIKQHGTLISLDDLRRFAKGARPPKNAVLLTFDDGYMDNYEVALPILQRANAPATFFVATAFPDERKLYWWDRVALLMRRCRKTRVVMSYPYRLELFPALDPARSARAVCKTMKLTPRLELVRFWDELERATGVTLSSEEEGALAERTIMGWREIRSLARAGMSVESHAHTHRVLQALPPEEAEQDLRRSRSVLEAALDGAPVDSVAYPVGYTAGAALRRASANAGFRFGFTNATGLCSLAHFDAFNVPRLGMDITTVGALYKLLLITGDRLPNEPRLPERMAPDPTSNDHVIRGSQLR